MHINLDIIFPIHDAPSAELMRIKAACLLNAGIIDAGQKEIVDQRARRFIRYDRDAEYLSAAYALSRRAA